jgi:LacI family transcriptional regulator
VSNALNSPELLRAETLARVRQAIERLGYSPNRAARNLRTSTSQLVGLRVEPASEDTANALMDRFVHSLVLTAREAGYHVLLFHVGPEEQPIEGYQNLLRSAAVDAFVVTDTFRESPQSAWLSEHGVPFVAFGRPWGAAPCDASARHPWVDVDGRAGAVMAVDHLVALGHTRIGWIGWQRGSYLGEDRRSGWTDRMHDHGLPTQRLSARGDDTLAFGARAAAALLDAEPSSSPTALVCASDTLAMGVLRYAAERGIRVGHDLAVVGFDDSIAAQVCSPGLTSVRQPLEQVAVELVGFLGDLLARREVSDHERILAPTLRVRASTKP